jgi:hypothetical protein
MRFPSTEVGDYTQQAGMTLAEIAYASPDNISKQLAYPHYAGKGVYRLQWLGVTAGNQMYVCRAPLTDQWIVVIRGSTTDPWQEAFWIDWFEQDLTTLHQEPLPFASPYNGGSMISWGTLQGFEDLIGMRDARTGLTLVEYLQNNATFEPGSIAVIGHSLGGALASVLTPYLYETLGRPNNISPDCFLPITFAAPTAGDINFAGYLQDLFSGYPFRFQNSQDVIPHAWDLAGLDWILASFNPAPKLNDFLYGLVDTTWWLLYEGSYFYTQPGIAVATPGSVQGYYWWFEEAGYQHAGETYLGMYGAPSVIFPVPPKSPQLTRRPRVPHPEIPLIRRQPPGVARASVTSPAPRLGA